MKDEIPVVDCDLHGIHPSRDGICRICNIFNMNLNTYKIMSNSNFCSLKVESRFPITTEIRSLLLQVEEKINEIYVEEKNTPRCSQCGDIVYKGDTYEYDRFDFCSSECIEIYNLDEQSYDRLAIIDPKKYE